MRKLAIVGALAAVAALGACQKTGEGEYQVQTPDIDVSTDTSTIRTPSIGTTTDTIRTPTMGTTQDTVIMTRPTVGTEQREIERPTVRRP
jgi:hypothetical protein